MASHTCGDVIAVAASLVAFVKAWSSDRCCFMVLRGVLCTSAALSIAWTLWFASRLPEASQPETAASEMAALAALRAPSIYLTHGGKRGVGVGLTCTVTGRQSLAPSVRPQTTALGRLAPRPASLASGFGFLALLMFTPSAGGPLPVIGGPGHASLTSFLKAWPKSLAQQPKALLVVSAHWEVRWRSKAARCRVTTLCGAVQLPSCPSPHPSLPLLRRFSGCAPALQEKEPTVTAAPQPELIYDYYGFPPESYKLSYPAPGSPELADKVCSLLKVRPALQPQLFCSLCELLGCAGRRLGRQRCPISRGTVFPVCLPSCLDTQAAGMECRKDPKRGWDHGVAPRSLTPALQGYSRCRPAAPLCLPARSAERARSGRACLCPHPGPLGLAAAALLLTSRASPASRPAPQQECSSH